MVYLTFNDSPGGVYKSQVTDVCHYLNKTFGLNIKLIALVSGRTYKADRKKIKELYSNSVVLPMYPGIANWEKNKLLLRSSRWLRKQDDVIARGVFAMLLARDCGSFNKVFFDGRGAYNAEWNEYLKEDNTDIARQMLKMESRAVLESNYRIAVSNQLVEYWKEKFRYMSSNHVVIPCTLNNDVTITYNESKIAATRHALSVTDNETLLVYSGSSAGWQSFGLLEEAITKAFIANTSLKLLMLCKPEQAKHLQSLFPERVCNKWIAENEVQDYLSAADYGLLIREESVTNKVSSPVKFAEYLAAGLPVIISNHIGDYSQFVEQKQCGTALEDVEWNNLKRPSATDKQRMQALANQYFRKENYKEQYAKLLGL